MSASDSHRLPADILSAYCLSGIYLTSLVIRVFVGPSLIIVGSVCLTLPVIFGAGLWLLSRLAAGERTLPRAIPLLLVFLSISSFFARPLAIGADLHTMVRIYRAHGPHHLNDWAQDLIQHYPGYGKIVDNETHEGIPSEIRNHIGGWIGVHGRAEQIPPVLRIELGGGFFHFGIFVVSSASAPQPEWWQGWINWPPEVMVYHDDD